MSRLQDRGGFTLMELLVALVLSTFLVTVIYQLMDGNSRFVRFQSAREEVQQNSRAALDLLASDLRTVPPSAIQAMGPDSIRFYLPRAFGILCDTIDNTSGTVWAIFPAGVLPTSDVFGKDNWGVAVEQTADPSTHTDTWRFVGGPSQQVSGNPCAGVQPTLVASEHTTLGFNRPGSYAYVGAGSILPGTQVMLFEEMKYDVAPSSSSAVPGNWIRRMVGRSGSSINMQPMAGPVPAAGALQLQYFRSDGVTATTTPSEVRKVTIRLVAQSRAESGTGVNRAPEQMDTSVTEVYLRNVNN